MSSAPTLFVLAGKITPVVKFTPTLLSGAIVQRATLFNIKNVFQLQLRSGSKVEVCRAGEVIPHVVRVVSGTSDRSGELCMDKYRSDAGFHCPCHLKQPLVQHDVAAPDYFCSAATCPEQLMQRLEHRKYPHPPLPPLLPSHFF